MKHALSLILGFGLLSASPSMGQELIAEYFTTIGPSDRFSSKGAPLRDFCAIVQQDRANFHRFGVRDQLDRGDPIFANRAARARISGRCRVMPGYEYIPDAVLRGASRHIWVQVYGHETTLQWLEIREGAG